MVASGTWTDPKSGASYAFGDRLPSADFNSWIGGIRTIDSNVVIGALSTFPHRLLPVAGKHRDAALDAFTGSLILVGDDTAGNATANTSPDMHAVLSGIVTSAAGFTFGTVDANSSGTIVGGLSGTGTSTGRVRRSIDAGTTWAVENLPTAASGVTSILWTGSVFVAAYDPGATTNRIATSTTGVTWTDRTNPLSNNAWIPTAQGGATTDGSGNVVLIPGDVGASSFTHSSDGGITWSSATTTAATWLGGAYSPGFGWIAYSRDGATIMTSSTGSSWVSATGKTLPPGFSAGWSVAAVGNVLAMLYNDGTSSYCAISPDWGATWSDRVLRFGGEIIISMRSSGGRLIVMDDQTNEYSFVSSRVVL